MKTAISASGVFLAACVAVFAGQPTAEQQKHADYFPLAVGSKWRYELYINQTKQKGAGSQIAKVETIKGVKLARHESSEDMYPEQIAVQYLSANEKGVFRHITNGLELDPPVCVLKYPIKENESWQSTTTVGGKQVTTQCSVGQWEEIKVPAGKFKAIPVDVSVKELPDVKGKFWYAANVGIVMQTTEFKNAIITLRLESYEKGK
jgi:hypothetical protein